MDILYRLESASVKDVMIQLEDDLSYSSVRTFLGKLETKGHVTHRESGLRYVYSPVVDRKTAAHRALGNVVSTFFRDSPYQAVNTLLQMPNKGWSKEELEQLEVMIEQHKNKTESTSGSRGKGNGTSRNS